MESRKSFVIIDIDLSRSEKTLNKLKQANAKARAVKTKQEIDEVYRTGGINAILIAPQVVGDIERLQQYYKAPIFVVGEVEPHQLPSLYQMNIVDIFSSDFKVSLLFEKLGLDYVEPVHFPTPNNRANASSLTTNKVQQEPIEQAPNEKRREPKSFLKPNKKKQIKQPAYEETLSEPPYEPELTEEPYDPPKQKLWGRNNPSKDSFNATKGFRPPKGNNPPPQGNYPPPKGSFPPKEDLEPEDFYLPPEHSPLQVELDGFEDLEVVIPQKSKGIGGIWKKLNQPIGKKK